MFFFVYLLYLYKIRRRLVGIFWSTFNSLFNTCSDLRPRSQHQDRVTLSTTRWTRNITYFYCLVNNPLYKSWEGGVGDTHSNNWSIISFIGLPKNDFVFAHKRCLGSNHLIFIGGGGGQEDCKKKFRLWFQEKRILRPKGPAKKCSGLP